MRGILIQCKAIEQMTDETERLLIGRGDGVAIPTERNQSSVDLFQDLWSRVVE